MNHKKNVVKIAGNIYYLERESDLIFLVHFLVTKGFRIDQIAYMLKLSEEEVLEYLKRWWDFK